MANKNSKRKTIIWYKHIKETTGHPPQHIPNNRKKPKVACGTAKRTTYTPKKVVEAVN